MTAITRVTQLRPHPHVHADDLEGDAEVTIKGWLIDEAGINKDLVGKLLLEEFSRPLIVNAGKRDALVAAFGDDVEALRGKKVILFPTTAQFQGKTVPSVGMRIPKGQ